MTERITRKAVKKSAVSTLDFLNGKTLLVTGGTGSFGACFVKAALQSKLKKLIVFSRDELKQYHMSRELSDKRLRFFLGDVRDLPRLSRAFQDVDIVVHAAALKQVPALEYNPSEAIKTNVSGTQNVIDAALAAGVHKVLFISTDKAVNPANLYGATKLCAEKLIIAANAYRGVTGVTCFSAVRYGNVLGSRGSLVELIAAQKKTGIVTLTHPNMTRFWLRLEDSVKLVMYGLREMRGGEIFIPKVPAMSVSAVIRALAPRCNIRVIGMRPGEKMHEVLLTDEECLRTRDAGFCYVIEPNAHHEWWNGKHLEQYPHVPDGFTYASDTANTTLTSKDLRDIAKLV